MPIWLSIVLGFVGSAGVFGFVEFLIRRHDEKKGLFKALFKRMDKIEKDSVRTQLLLLISDYPNEKQQIMMLAEYYFVTLKSNWYLTGIFQSYLDKNNIPIPKWFKAND